MYELNTIGNVASLRWYDIDASTSSVHPHPPVVEAMGNLDKLADTCPVQLTFHLPKDPAFYAELKESVKRFLDLRIVLHKWDRTLIATQDVKQLNAFPRLRRLKIELRDDDEAGALAGCTALRELSCSSDIGEETEISVSLDSFQTLRELRHLSLNGNFQDLSWMKKVESLQRLSISESGYTNLDFLNGNQHLKVLRLDNNHELENIDVLADMEILYLYLCRLPRLQRIPSIPRIKHLELRRLPEISSLPVFTQWKNFQVLVIEHVEKLRDLSPLCMAQALKQLKVMGASHMEVADFEVLKWHPSLTAISVGTGSPAKNAAIEKLLPFRVKQDIPWRDPELQRLLQL